MTSDVGNLKTGLQTLPGTTLEKSEECLEGKDKEEFLAFVRLMLQWRLEDRKTAKQLLQEPWLNEG